MLHAVLILAVGWIANRYPPHALNRIGAVVLAGGAIRSTSR